MYSKKELETRFSPSLAPTKVFIVSKVEVDGEAVPIKSFQTNAGAEDFIKDQSQSWFYGYEIEEIPHSGY